jgi:hypothetical protein
MTYKGSEHEGQYKKLLEREGYSRRWPNGPAKHTLGIARRIRRDFGWGDGRFPGSKQLDEAATLIEGWQADWEAQQKPKYEPGPVPGFML